MKRISLQWRLTCIITLYIAVICGCLTMFVYKNGVYYIESLQETVDAQGEVMEMNQMKYISVFRKTSGTNLQMIFRSRYTTIRRITKKAA